MSTANLHKSTARTIKEEYSNYPGNKVILKVAWYASDLFGVASSIFRSPPMIKSPRNISLDLPTDGSASPDRSTVRHSEASDSDVSRNLTPDVYEENYEFADPVGSFKGLRCFMRNSCI
ncbi:hypothetical protein LINPERHAP1_LOCUS10042 [Linum perenne]